LVLALVLARTCASTRVGALTGTGLVLALVLARTSTSTGSSVAVASILLSVIGVASVVSTSSNVTALGVGIGGDDEADTVILSTTLSDGHEDRLMVGSGGHSAASVVTGGETLSKDSGEQSIAVSSVVDTLEEGECVSCRRCGTVDVLSEILHGEMGVADDLATLELLRSGVVGVVRICEGSSHKVGNLSGESDLSVRSNDLAVGRAGDHS
jgi:hypothetical protein